MTHRRYGLLVVCIALAVAASPASATSGRKLALSAGVNNFQDASWHDLRYPIKDAGDVSRALRGEFDRVLHLGSHTPLTKAAFLASLHQLSLLNTSRLDTVVVYVSTHGTLARDHRGNVVRVLVFHDTDRTDVIGTGLPYRQLVSALAKLRSKRKLLVLAACHSGTGKSVLSPELARELRSLKGPFFPQPSVPAGEGQIIVAASAWGEPAREDDRLRNDVYTHFFVKALTGYDRNRDGATSAMEAHDYARSRTLAFTKGRQRPTLTAEIVGGDPVILRGTIRQAGDPVIVAYGAAFAEATLEINGRSKGVLPGGFVVPPGRYRVRVRRPNATAAMLTKQVTLEAGQLLRLEQLLRSEPRQWTVTADFGWQFPRRARVSSGYLASFPVAVVGLGYQFADTFALGIRLSGTAHDQTVRLRSNGVETQATQSLQLLKTAAVATVGLLKRRSLALSAQTTLGWAVGARDIRLPRVTQERVSFGFAGAGLETSLWLSPHIGLRVETAMELLALRVEGKAQWTLADRYSAGLVVNF